MQPYPHFHWVALDGKRPNIPENFIREDFKVTPVSEDVKMQVEGIQSIVQQPNIEKRNAKIIPPVIHNISKELQIFLDNFEQRFRKEIKVSRLSTSDIFTITKELAISNNIIIQVLMLSRMSRE
jgi:hypothetical protein